MSKKATREALGATLVELASEGVDVVAVEADLSKSTTTNKLDDAYPDRFFNVGIAEANMIDVAAGSRRGRQGAVHRLLRGVRHRAAPTTRSATPSATPAST